MSRLPAILTPRDLADHLRVSEATVRANAEEWGGFRVGKQWRFHRDATLRLVAPEPDTLDAEWQDADDHQSPLRSDQRAADGGVSAGASTDPARKSVDTAARTKRRTARTRSGSAFAKAFPEHAKNFKSAS